jgi:hypothetical protein
MIFSNRPLNGVSNHENNVLAEFSRADRYLRNPTDSLTDMDFRPKEECADCQGQPLDIARVSGQLDFDVDFARQPKTQFVHRGAFARPGPAAANPSTLP